MIWFDFIKNERPGNYEGTSVSKTTQELKSIKQIYFLPTKEFFTNAIYSDYADPSTSNSQTLTNHK